MKAPIRLPEQLNFICLRKSQVILQNIRRINMITEEHCLQVEGSYVDFEVNATLDVILVVVQLLSRV